MNISVTLRTTQLAGTRETQQHEDTIPAKEALRNLVKNATAKGPSSASVMGLFPSMFGGGDITVTTGTKNSRTMTKDDATRELNKVQNLFSSGSDALAEASDGMIGAPFIQFDPLYDQQNGSMRRTTPTPAIPIRQQTQQIIEKMKTTLKLHSPDLSTIDIKGPAFLNIANNLFNIAPFNDYGQICPEISVPELDNALSQFYDCPNLFHAIVNHAIIIDGKHSIHIADSWNKGDTDINEPGRVDSIEYLIAAGYEATKKQKRDIYEGSSLMHACFSAFAHPSLVEIFCRYHCNPNESMKVGSFVRNSPCLLQVFDNMYDCFFMDALEKMRYLIYYGARVIDNTKALDKYMSGKDPTSGARTINGCSRYFDPVGFAILLSGKDLHELPEGKKWVAKHFNDSAQRLISKAEQRDTCAVPRGHLTFDRKHSEKLFWTGCDPTKTSKDDMILQVSRIPSPLLLLSTLLYSMMMKRSVLTQCPFSVCLLLL